MNPLDLVLAGLLLFGAYKGYRQGLVAVVIHTLALLCALILAFRLLATVSQWLEPFVSQGKMVLPVLSFALVFFLVFWGLQWFAGFTSRNLRKTVLGPFDQAAGAALGFFRMALVLSSVILAATYLGITWSFTGKNPSVLLPLLQSFSHRAFSVLKPLLPFLQDFLKEFTQTAPAK